MAGPLVTCVMVTGHQPERRPLALQAVECFRRQTYFPRELLVVNEGEPLGLFDANIRELRVSAAKRTLGDFRNIGLLSAQGELVLQWDDDDLYGRERIAVQVNAGWPNVLREEIFWDTLTGDACVVSAAQWKAGGFPGSILHPADTPHRYPPLAKEEDTCFAAQFRLRAVPNNPGEYVRRLIGGSTSGREHFARLMSTGRPLSPPEERYLGSIRWWLDHPRRACRSIAEVKDVLQDLRWMGWPTAKYLDALIRREQLRDVLEIGTLHGVGACYLAATGAAVTTVDLPASAGNLPNVEDTLAACGLTATIVRQPSRHFLAAAAVDGRTWDLIYVDGSHTLADAWCDVLLADLVLRAGGYLVMDDIAHEALPAVRQVWERLPSWYDRQPGPQANCGVARKRAS